MAATSPDDVLTCSGKFSFPPQNGHLAEKEKQKFEFKFNLQFTLKQISDHKSAKIKSLYLQLEA